MSYPHALRAIAAKHGTSVVGKAVKHFEAEEDMPKKPVRRKAAGASSIDDEIAKMSVQDMFNIATTKLHFNPTEPNLEKIFGIDKVFRVVAPGYEPLKLLKSEDVESAAIGLLSSYFGAGYKKHTFTIRSQGFIFILWRDEISARDHMIKFFKPRYEMHSEMAAKSPATPSSQGEE